MAAIQEHLLRFRTDPESAALTLDCEPIKGQAEHVAFALAEPAGLR